MGQYYILVNLTTGEYVHPHDVGDGAKLMEIAYSTHGLMTALTVLLASGNGRGNGDVNTDHPLVGRWAGHRVVLAGDYDDHGLFCADFAAAVAARTGAPAVAANFDPDGERLYQLASNIGRNLAPELYDCFASAREAFGQQSFITQGDSGGELAPAQS